MATISPTATILHLSDLHLGEDFDDTGSGDKATVTSAIKKLRIEMQAHDAYIIAGLRLEVKLSARFMGAPDDRFDFNVITGDISTTATPSKRFAFARDFLVGTVPLSKTFSVGLELNKDKLLCVPGNHDRMYESEPERYLTSFENLPEPPPYVVEADITRSNQRLVFYGIDSNLYEEGNIAIGRIYPATMAWLGEQFEKSDPVDRQHEGTVRILLLHHHPADLNRFRRRANPIKRFFMDRLTVLQEGQRLLKLCRGKVDLIMHGHEHFPVVFADEESGCLIVSAGTVSEWQPGSRQNSFHGLAFEGRKFRVVQFDWNKARFKPVLEWTGDFDSPGCGLTHRRIN